MPKFHYCDLILNVKNAADLVSDFFSAQNMVAMMEFGHNEAATDI